MCRLPGFRACGRTVRFGLLVAAAFSSSLIAAKDAAIRLPEAFAPQATRIEFSGFGGFNRGQYTGGGYRGEFVRTESRLGVFDPLYVANRGRSSYTLADTDGTPLLTASCRMTRDTASIKVVSVDLNKMAYDCTFEHDGGSGMSHLVLGEPKREGLKAKLLARERRTGEASMAGRAFTIESVHEYEGSRLVSQTPLGYLIAADQRIVAAVDLLDWNPVVFLDRNSDVAEARAAISLALALAVLRDPANSTLED